MGLCLGSLWSTGEGGHSFMALGTGWRGCLSTGRLPEAVGAQDDAWRASVQTDGTPDAQKHLLDAVSGQKELLGR